MYLDIQNKRFARAVSYALDVNFGQHSDVTANTYSELDMNKIHNELVDKVERYAEEDSLNDEDLIKYLNHFVTNVLLPDSKLAWIDRDNRRLCNFLDWVIKSNTFSRERFIRNRRAEGLGANQSERYNAVIFFCDIQSLNEREDRLYQDFLTHADILDKIHAKSKDINKCLKQAWREVEELSSYYKSFINDDELSSERESWGWDYIQNKRLNMSNIIKTQGYSYADLIMLTFDAMAFQQGVAEAELALRKMRNAWYQKRSKMKGDTKSISFNLSPSSIKKLKELKAFHGNSNSALVEALIESAHKKMLKQKLSLQDNLLDD